jgi:hypothetical protein
MELLTVWQELLGTAEAGVRENFVDAGGTSILATRLAGRIQNQFGCKVTAADIFAHPSVQMLAEWLGGSGASLPATESERRAEMQRRAFGMVRPQRSTR